MESWYIIIGSFITETSVDKSVVTKRTDRKTREAPMCIAAANRIINRTNAHNMWRVETGKTRVKLTGKRLQKLLYLCQIFWYIDHEDCKMITENFEAWPNGPVIPEIYDFFSVYQDGDMRPLMGVGTHALSKEERDLINKVVDSTIDISTEAMIDYTHLPDSPWNMVYKDGKGLYDPIPKKIIKKYINNPRHQQELSEFIRNV